ncbi:MAG: hypothetical protein COU46_03765 [Candidatus Niyogibacteria bacterium CG10_big_fil_rev_8_21_14_0_10_42_19]|uniref:Uncharacterized protein n=1 Tax=Candidatus Niyogibacteria bacterium CG10_big_fil_rev_8_21_14_0_10_42_19 TaxID=1974725 RepID=A0A2H0TGD7_9BACT|nr:MAG: hypothetical protein COU46_03765 [Candidatus Niyogibacteria bacterium CG10_big_fil_rev_8_21_14_0_10_42_19]
MDKNNESPKVVFGGEELQLSAQSFQAPTPKIMQWVMKYSWGVIKNEKQASYVLVGFAVLTIIISLFLIFGGKPVGNPEDIKILPAVF